MESGDKLRVQKSADEEGKVESSVEGTRVIHLSLTCAAP